MKEIVAPDLRMSSKAVYQLSIMGILDHQWSDWLNGATIKIEKIVPDRSITFLLCQVRDQAELHGIINKLYTLNLPLVSVQIMKNGW